MLQTIANGRILCVSLLVFHLMEKVIQVRVVFGFSFLAASLGQSFLMILTVWVKILSVWTETDTFPLPSIPSPNR